MTQQICSSCGNVGIPVHATKGSCLIELVLWLFFIVPGLIYTIWRRSGKPATCPKCQSPTMIPIDSPTAKKMLEERPELTAASTLSMPTAGAPGPDEISLEAESKKCPTCAEIIKLEALKCRFCGTDLDPDEVARQAEARRAELLEEVRLAREREGRTQCPQCKSWDVRWATIEDGGVGHWCDTCKKSLKAMGVA